MKTTTLFSPTPKIRKPSRNYHQILSPLPQNLFSKTEYSALPVLEFDIDSFSMEENTLPDFDFDEEGDVIDKNAEHGPHGKKLNDKFSEYVEDTINRHTLSDIGKFKIIINSQEYGDRKLNLDKWLSFTVSHNVQELVLHHRSDAKEYDKREWRYELPVEFLSKGEKIKELDLFGCKVISTGDTNFRLSLRKLHLVHVDISEKALQSMLDSCCFVEDFRMINCTGFHKVKLAGNKLERVDLNLTRGYDQIIEIEASNLKVFSCSGDSANISRSLMSSNCENMEALTLHDANITDELFKVVSKFPNLQKLEVVRCSFLKIVEISPNIQISDLSISGCSRLWRIVLDCSRLDRLKHEESNMELAAIKGVGFAPITLTSCRCF